MPKNFKALKRKQYISHYLVYLIYIYIINIDYKIFRKFGNILIKFLALLKQCCIIYFFFYEINDNE